MEEKLELLKKLQEVNSNITEDTIKNASKEELIEYLKLIDEIDIELGIEGEE